jgi:hypothetical protein
LPIFKFADFHHSSSGTKTALYKKIQLWQDVEIIISTAHLEEEPATRAISLSQAMGNRSINPITIKIKPVGTPLNIRQGQ